jgi:hypothetical protein
MNWHHRTIRHIDSRYPETEPYETVHEFSFDRFALNPEYDGWSFSYAAALSKQEAQWMMEAYNLPPVMEVDDASYSVDAQGTPDYADYKWLDKEVPKKQTSHSQD